MNESDMPNISEIEAAAQEVSDLLNAQMAKDEERFRYTIERILRKCENGMCTKDDIFELRACLKYYGIEC